MKSLSEPFDPAAATSDRQRTTASLLGLKRRDIADQRQYLPAYIGLDIRSLIVGSQISGSLVRVMIAPDRHFACAMAGDVLRSADDLVGPIEREHPAVGLRQSGQVGRLLVDETAERPIALGRLAMTDRSTGFEFVLADVDALRPGGASAEARPHRDDDCNREDRNQTFASHVRLPISSMG